MEPYKHHGAWHYRFGSFALDAGGRQLLRRGREIHLTPKEMDVLLLLVANAGRAMSKEEILQGVWQEGGVEEGNLTQTISLLRKVLGSYPGGQACIETVARYGYRFRMEVHEEPNGSWWKRRRLVVWAAGAGLSILLAIWGWLFYTLGASR